MENVSCCFQSNHSYIYIFIAQETVLICQEMDILGVCFLPRELFLHQRDVFLEKLCCFYSDVPVRIASN